MHKVYAFLIALFVINSVAHAQKTREKEVELDETTIVAGKKKEEAAIGAKVTHISDEDLKTNLTKSLSEILWESSPIQIKSMGQGGMATASFRGTASSHTQVMWNGISINSTQLGSFDLSMVPIYFVDDISLYHGGSAQKGGSGALGGNINFGSNAAYHGTRPGGSLLFEVGSNDTYTGAGSFRFAKNRFSSSTRFFYQQSDNDYKYLNTVYQKDPFYERRKNADYKQSGVMQGFNYRTSATSSLSATCWWQYDHRSLPQGIYIDNIPMEKNKTNNIRSMMSYDATYDNATLNATVAYFHSTMDYSRSFSGQLTDESSNINNSIVAKADYTYMGINRLLLTSIFNYRFDEVKSDNYADASKTRHTLNATGVASYRITPRLHIDARIPLEWSADRFYARYNLSARYRIIDEWLTLKATNGYNYRIPTLNDMYWQPGGNPDLKPEKGFSSDFTISTEPQFSAVGLKLEATYYYMNIDDWIMWVVKDKGPIWEPVNFSNVISQGVEVNADVRVQWGKMQHTLSGNYAYTHSVDNSYREEGTQGKQLPYIPRNRWNVGYRFNYNQQFWFHYNVSYTDARFTSADESYQTEAYTLHNAEAGYQWRMAGGMNLDFSIKADNLFNVYHESTQYYPMPLRMIWGRVVYTF